MMKDAGERAMALVDGQLAPAEVPDLVRELARSPALVAELQTTWRRREGASPSLLRPGAASRFRHG